MYAYYDCQNLGILDFMLFLVYHACHIANHQSFHSLPRLWLANKDYKIISLRTHSHRRAWNGGWTIKDKVIWLTNPEVESNLNNAPVIAWDVDIEVLVEAWFYWTERRQRRKVICNKLTNTLFSPPTPAAQACRMAIRFDDAIFVLVFNGSSSLIKPYLCWKWSLHPN